MYPVIVVCRRPGCFDEIFKVVIYSSQLTFFMNKCWIQFIQLTEGIVICCTALQATLQPSLSNA